MEHSKDTKAEEFKVTGDWIPEKENDALQTTKDKNDESVVAVPKWARWPLC